MSSIDIQSNGNSLVVSFSSCETSDVNNSCTVPESCARGRRTRKVPPVIRKLLSWELLVAQDSNERRYLKASQGTGNPYASPSFVAKTNPVPLRYLGRYTASGPFSVVEKWITRSLQERRGPSEAHGLKKPLKQAVVEMSSTASRPKKAAGNRCSTDVTSRLADQKKKLERQSAELKAVIRRQRAAARPRIAELGCSPVSGAVVAHHHNLLPSASGGCLPTVLVMFEDEDAPFLTLRNCVHPLDSIAELREQIVAQLDKTCGGDILSREMAWSFSGANPPLVVWLEELYSDFLTFYTDNEHMRLSGQAAKEVRFATKQHRYLADVLKPLVHHVRRLTERMTSVYQLCQQVPIPPSLASKYGTPLSKFFGQTELFFGPARVPLTTGFREVHDAVNPVKHAVCAQLERKISGGAPPVDCGLTPYKATFKRAALQVVSDIRRARAKASFQPVAGGVPRLPIIRLRKLPKLFTAIARSSELKEIQIRDAVTRHATPSSESFAISYVPSKSPGVSISAASSPRSRSPGSRRSSRTFSLIEQQSAAVDDVAAIEMAMEEQPCPSLRWADALGLSLPHYALLRQDIRMLQALCIRQADISVPDSAGCTVLHRLLLLRNCRPGFKLQALSELLNGCSTERMLENALRARLHFDGDTVLGLAARIGDLDLVQVIFDAIRERLLPVASTLLRTHVLQEELAAIAKFMPIERFIASGDVNGVRFWLDHMQLNVNEFRCAVSQIPLLCAVLCSRCPQPQKDELIVLLLMRGASPLESDAAGRSALHYAVISRQMHWLLQFVEEITRRSFGGSASSKVIENRHKASGANTADHRGNTFIHLMLEKCRSQADLEQHGLHVLQHPTILSSLDLGRCNRAGNSLLHLVMLCGNSVIAKQLTKTLMYESHHTIETLFCARNENGDTPLGCAVRRGFAAGLHMTLSIDVVAEVALRTRNSFDRSLLLLAVDCEGAKTFIGDKAPPMANRPHCDARTQLNVLQALLTYASSQSDPKEIIDEISGDRSECALHSAVRNELWHTAALLLTFQASSTVRSPVSGLTPLELSFANRSDAAIARLLLANDRSGVASVATLRCCIAARGAAAFNIDLLQQHFFSREALLDLVDPDDSENLLCDCVSAGNLQVFERLFTMGILPRPSVDIFGSLLRACMVDARRYSRDVALPRKAAAALGPSSPQFSDFDVESLLMRMLLLHAPIPACALFYAVTLRYERLAALLIRLPEERQLEMFAYVDATTGSSTLHELCSCTGENWWKIAVHVVYSLSSRQEVFRLRDKFQRTPLHAAHDVARVDMMLLLMTQNSFVGNIWARRYCRQSRPEISTQDRLSAHWTLVHATLPLAEVLVASVMSKKFAIFDTSRLLPTWGETVIHSSISFPSGALGALAASGDCDRLRSVINHLTGNSGARHLDQSTIDMALYGAIESVLVAWPQNVLQVLAILLTAMQQKETRSSKAVHPTLLDALFFVPAASCSSLPIRKFQHLEEALGMIIPAYSVQVSRFSAPLEQEGILSSLLSIMARTSEESDVIDRCLIALFECCPEGTAQVFCCHFTVDHLSIALRRNLVLSLTAIARSFGHEQHRFPLLASLTQLPMPSTGSWLVSELAATSVPTEAVACVLDRSREEVHAVKQQSAWWVEELLDLRSSKFQQLPHATQRAFPVLCFLRNLSKTDPATVRDFTKKARSPLHAAIALKRSALVAHMLHVSPFAVLLDLDLDAEDYRQRTPLILAAKFGETAVFRDLLNLGANMMAEDDRGFTCLHTAAQNGFDEIIQAIKEHEDGSHVLRSNTSEGSNALLQAVKAGQDRSATLLLSYPIYTDSLIATITHRGENLIHFCALRECTQTLQILLRRCSPAYVQAVTPCGFTARDYCKPRSQVDAMLAAASVPRRVRLTLSGRNSLSSEDMAANPNILSFFDHRKDAASLLLRVHERLEPMSMDERAWMLASRGMDNDLLELMKLGATDLVRVRFTNLPNFPSEAAKHDFAKDLQTLLGNRFGGAQRVDVFTNAPTPYALALLRDESRMSSVIASDSIAVHGQLLQATRDPSQGPTYRTKIIPNASSILHEACKTGCVKSINYAISSNSPGGIPSRLICDLLTKHFDSMGLSPYHYAVLQKQWAIALELIRWRIPVYPARDFPRTPLEMFPSLPHLTEVRASVAVGLPGNPSTFAFGDDSKFNLDSRITEADADLLGYVRVKNSSNVAAATRVQRSLLTCDLDKLISGQIVSALASITDMFDFDSPRCNPKMRTLLRAHLRGETMRWNIDIQTADDRDNALERERCKGLFRYHLAGGVLLRALSSVIETLLTAYGLYGQLSFLSLKKWVIACAKNVSAVKCTVDPSDGEIVICVFVLPDNTLVFPDVLATLEEYFLFRAVAAATEALVRYSQEEAWLRIVTLDALVTSFLDLLRTIENCVQVEAMSEEVLRVLGYLHVKLQVNGVTPSQLTRKLQGMISVIDDIRERCLQRERGQTAVPPREIILPGNHHHAVAENCCVIISVAPLDGGAAGDVLEDVSPCPPFHGLQLLRRTASEGFRMERKKKMRGISLLLKARVSARYETSVVLSVKQVTKDVYVSDDVQLICGFSWPAAATRPYMWSEAGINASRLQRVIKSAIPYKKPLRTLLPTAAETSQASNVAKVEDVSITLLQTPLKQKQGHQERAARSPITSLTSSELRPLISALKEAVLPLYAASAVDATPPPKQLTRELRSRKQHGEMDAFLLRVFEFSLDVKFALCVMRLVSKRWNESILRLLHFERRAEKDEQKREEPLSIFEALLAWTGRADVISEGFGLQRERASTVRCGEAQSVLELLRGQQLLGPRLSMLQTPPRRTAQFLWEAFLRDPLSMFAHVASSCGLREAAFRENLPRSISTKKCPTAAGKHRDAPPAVIEAYFRHAYSVIRWATSTKALLDQVERWNSRQERLRATASPAARLGS